MCYDIGVFHRIHLFIKAYLFHWSPVHKKSNFLKKNSLQEKRCFDWVKCNNLNLSESSLSHYTSKNSYFTEYCIHSNILIKVSVVYKIAWSYFRRNGCPKCLSTWRLPCYLLCNSLQINHYDFYSSMNSWKLKELLKINCWLNPIGNNDTSLR